MTLITRRYCCCSCGWFHFGFIQCRRSLSLRCFLHPWKIIQKRTNQETQIKLDSCCILLRIPSRQQWIRWRWVQRLIACRAYLVLLLLLLKLKLLWWLPIIAVRDILDVLLEPRRVKEYLSQRIIEVFFIVLQCHCRRCCWCCRCSCSCGCCFWGDLVLLQLLRSEWLAWRRSSHRISSPEYPWVRQCCRGWACKGVIIVVVCLEIQFSFGYGEIHSRVGRVDFSWATHATTATTTEQGVIVSIIIMCGGVKDCFISWISSRREGCANECLWRSSWEAIEFDRRRRAWKGVFCMEVITLVVAGRLFI